MDITKEKLDDIFTYHAPHGDQQARYVQIRSVAKTLADTILSNVQGSAERTLALRKLQEAVMWANAGIAINESRHPAASAPATT